MLNPLRVVVVEDGGGEGAGHRYERREEPKWIRIVNCGDVAGVLKRRGG